MLGIPLVLARPLHEAPFVSNAFTFHNGASTCNAPRGFLTPLFSIMNRTETSDHGRERKIRQISAEAIAQATAVAKTSRALRTRTTIVGQHYYHKSDLVDYRRPQRPVTTGGMEWSMPGRT